jgi:signal transduction histidine kinase
MEGSLELAERTGDPADFDRCRQAIDQMQSRIEDLLTLARDGKIAGSTAPVDLAATAKSAWQRVPTEDATLSVTADSVVEADAHRLEQLFENLFRNSVEHSSTSNRTASDDPVEYGAPSVTVRAGDLANGFFVADDGPGIPAESRADVFETGYSTKPDGTGFGLDIVSQIANAHGWAVEATASSDGGARFEFTGVQRHE